MKPFTPEFNGVCQSQGRTFSIDSFQVYDWPGSMPQRPAEEVRLSLTAVGLQGEFTLKLRSRRACDALIQELTKHRRSVWPEGMK